MPLQPGSRLGSYEILAPLGAGGMGEVHRARHLKLGREVAIKVLPASVADEPERLARFEREARTASALNHPNIVTIYDIATDGGVTYIAMELIRGRTLSSDAASPPSTTGFTRSVRSSAPTSWSTATSTETARLRSGASRA